MSAPYSIQFITDENEQVVAVQVQVMTGFQKPNNYILLSSIPYFSTLEEFEAKVLDSMSEKAVAKKYPTEQSRLDAVETEVLSANVHKGIIALLQDSAVQQDFANLLAANADRFYMEFCDKHSLIPNRLKELWGVNV